MFLPIGRPDKSLFLSRSIFHSFRYFLREDFVIEVLACFVSRPIELQIRLGFDCISVDHMHVQNHPPLLNTSFLGHYRAKALYSFIPNGMSLYFWFNSNVSDFMHDFCEMLYGRLMPFMPFGVAKYCSQIFESFRIEMCQTYFRKHRFTVKTEFDYYFL